MPENGELIEVKATVKDTCCSAVTAQDVKVRDSAICNMEAVTAKMDHSAIGYAQAETIQVKNSAILIANATELRGDVNPVFTPATAAIFGAAVGAGLFIVGQFFSLVARR